MAEQLEQPWLRCQFLSWETPKTTTTVTADDVTSSCSLVQLQLKTTLQWNKRRAETFAATRSHNECKKKPSYTYYSKPCCKTNWNTGLLSPHMYTSLRKVMQANSTHFLFWDSSSISVTGSLATSSLLRLRGSKQVTVEMKRSSLVQPPMIRNTSDRKCCTRGLVRSETTCQHVIQATSTSNYNIMTYSLIQLLI